MSTPTFFAVERTMLGQQYALYHGEILPQHRAGILYMLRLDTLPDAERWLAMSVTNLGDWYERLKIAGKLPASEGIRG